MPEQAKGAGLKRPFSFFKKERKVFYPKRKKAADSKSRRNPVAKAFVGSNPSPRNNLFLFRKEKNVDEKEKPEEFTYGEFMK